MAAKMSPKFVVLCTIAVGTIYATGYTLASNPNNSSTGGAQAASTIPIKAPSTPSTEKNGPATRSEAPVSSKTTTETSQKSTPKQSTEPKVSTVIKPTTTGAKSTSTQMASKSGAATTSRSSVTSKSVASKPTPPPVEYRYLDGTYTGSGSNRIGTIQVAVTVKSGKVINCEITGCYTHYPESYINPALPDYVVQNQTTQVPYISGATLSSDDFHNAVAEALSRAANPKYTG